jgi:hypothetical protein
MWFVESGLFLVGFMLFFLLPDWTRRPSPAAKELVFSAARS